MVSVYKITNEVNGKLYIGITLGCIKRRWRHHKWIAFHHKRGGAFQSAIRKYGPNRFEVELIYEAVTALEAQVLERALIAQYGTLVPNGYNMTTGGEANGGHSVSPETREKIKKIAQNRVMSDATKQKHREIQAALWKDPEYRKSYLENRKKNGPSKAQMDHFQRVRQTFEGRKHSEETREKMKQDWTKHRGHMVGRVVSPETGRKISAALSVRVSPLRGRKAPPEVCAKIREAKLKYWAAKRRQFESPQDVSRTMESTIIG